MAEEASFVEGMVVEADDDDDDVVVVVDVGDDEEDMRTKEEHVDVTDNNGFGVLVDGNPLHNTTTQQNQQQTKRLRQPRTGLYMFRRWLAR